MQLTLTTEQDLLRKSVAKGVAREASLAKLRTWTDSGDFEGARQLALRQGWPGIGTIESHGGQGGGVQELAIVAEQLGRGAVPWDWTLSACISARLLAEAGTAGMPLLERCASGLSACAACVDASRVLEPVEGQIEGDRVTAVVPFVLGALSANEFILPLARGSDVLLCAFARNAQGVTVRPRPLVDKSRSLADVALADVVVEPVGQLSLETLQAIASIAAVLVSADALGAAARLLEMTASYIKQRHQFGVPVGSFQAVKHLAAQMLVDVEGSRSAVDYGVWAVDAKIDQAVLHSFIAKAHACDAAYRAADRALFLHGAIGYTWDYDLQFLFKRVKSDQLVFGRPDAYRDRIASMIGLTAP